MKRLALAAAVAAAASCGGGASPAAPRDGAAPAEAGSEVAAGACGFVDPEPNDSRDRATPYLLGGSVQGCIAAQTDHDFFEFPVPDDAAGGFVQVAVTEVGRGYIALRVFAASDNGEIGYYYASNAGQSLNAFFAVARGQKYRLDLHDFSSFDRPYAYKVTATYTRVSDAFEPNDTRMTAKALLAASTVTGFLFAGFVSGDALKDSAYDDWYAVSLTPGSVTIKLEDVPTDISPWVYLFDPSGAELDNKYSTTAGASLTLTKATTSTGMHLIRVTVFTRPPAEGKGTTVPDHFTRPYRLSVRQP